LKFTGFVAQTSSTALLAIRMVYDVIMLQSKYMFDGFKISLVTQQSKPWMWLNQ